MILAMVTECKAEGQEGPNDEVYIDTFLGDRNCLRVDFFLCNGADRTSRSRRVKIIRLGDGGQCRVKPFGEGKSLDRGGRQAGDQKSLLYLVR